MINLLKRSLTKPLSCEGFGIRCFSSKKPSEEAIQIVKPFINYNYIKENVEKLQENADKRKSTINIQNIANLYEKYRGVKHELDMMRANRNLIAKKMKTASQAEREKLAEEGREWKDKVVDAEVEHNKLLQDLNGEALKIPNDTHPSSPVGPEANARTVEMVGEKPKFDFPIQDHLEIGERLGLIKSAAQMTGAKYYYYTNEAALLEMALTNWAFSKMSFQHGFKPVITPDLIHPSLAEGCGFQPRSEASQMFWVKDHDMVLTATSEVPLAALYANGNTVIEAKDLPIKMVGYSHCFRSETGHGQYNRGIYRVHQFSKVEMFVISKPDLEESNKILEDLLKIQVDMFKELGLHFRVLDMPTEDLGAPAYKKYDIEVWIPSRDSYGEISSASNCTDYQSKRLNMKIQEFNSSLTTEQLFVHTLNGTAVAIPRLILAILENNQQADGSILIPQVLRPFMNNQEFIGKKNI